MFAIRNKCHATSSNSNGLQPNSDVLHERKRPSVLLRVCHRRIRVATQYWLRNARIQNGNGLLVGRVIVVSLSCFVVSLSFCLQISLLVEDRAGKYITFWVMVCYWVGQLDSYPSFSAFLLSARVLSSKTTHLKSWH